MMDEYCSYLLKFRMDSEEETGREIHRVIKKSENCREAKTGWERLVHGYIVSIKSFDISKLCAFIKMYH